ncbi:MAG TPA: hypothetical protein VN038_11745 [Dyadobacter sp.]|nr:hypothetical protein [Dyadobacter sp.]
MNKVTLNSLFLSTTVLLISTIGGALIAQKLAQGGAGFSFLWFSCPIALFILTLQLTTFSPAKQKLLFQLLFLGFFGLSMVWFMLSLFLPIFWIREINTSVKFTLFAIFITVMIFNLRLGWKALNKRWNETGATAFEAEFKKTATVDWNKVVRDMKITHNIFIPGIPEGWTSFVSIILIIFMILGLNLRLAYPVFSVFAWGIPAIFIASYFIQVCGFYFAQAVQVRRIEKNLNIMLKSTN